MNIGENIKKIRLRAGLTQEEVALNLCVTRQTVSSWETGKTEPDIESIKAFCFLTKADLNDVLAYRTSPEPLTLKEKLFTRTNLLLSAGLVSCLLAELLLKPVLYRYMQKYYIAMGYIIYRLSIQPLAFFLAGWLGTNCVLALCGTQAPVKPVAGIIKIVALAILVIYVCSAVFFFCGVTILKPVSGFLMFIYERLYLFIILGSMYAVADAQALRPRYKSSVS